MVEFDGSEVVPEERELRAEPFALSPWDFQEDGGEYQQAARSIRWLPEVAGMVDDGWFCSLPLPTLQIGVPRFGALPPVMRAGVPSLVQFYARPRQGCSPFLEGGLDDPHLFVVSDGDGLMLRGLGEGPVILDGGWPASGLVSTAPDYEPGAAILFAVEESARRIAALWALDLVTPAFFGRKRPRAGCAATVLTALETWTPRNLLEWYTLAAPDFIRFLIGARQVDRVGAAEAKAAV
jgi:hypothetical protein